MFILWIWTCTMFFSLLYLQFCIKMHWWFLISVCHFIAPCLQLHDLLFMIFLLKLIVFYVGNGHLWLRIPLWSLSLWFLPLAMPPISPSFHLVVNVHWFYVVGGGGCGGGCVVVHSVFHNSFFTLCFISSYIIKELLFLSVYNMCCQPIAFYNCHVELTTIVSIHWVPCPCRCTQYF